MPHRYAEALRPLRLPAAFVDTDVVEANLNHAVELADGTPLRLATKSVRIPAVIERALAHESVIGLMCAAAHEAAWWAERGVRDILIAYPSMEHHDLRACAAHVRGGAHIRFMVDSEVHLRALARAAAEEDVELEACLDLDLSVEIGGRRGLRFGVHRSPVRDVHAALALSGLVHTIDGVRLTGLMGYEAQLAGLQDRPADAAVTGLAVRLLKASTRESSLGRRTEVVRALRAAGVELSLVNGGGSGSVPLTSSRPEITEVAVGSALLAPALFDGYDDVHYTPAAGFGLRVTRIPEPGVVTCYGGGWVASGAAGADRLPSLWHPAGAALLSNEGAGEVQTPVGVPDDVELAVGDVVVLRHAKAGELADRVGEVHLLRGAAREAHVPTYRGLGLVLS